MKKKILLEANAIGAKSQVGTEERHRGRYNSSRENEEVTMKEIDQGKFKEEIQKILLEKMRDKTKSKTIKDDKWKRKKYIECSAKEIQLRTLSKSGYTCGTYKEL